MEENQSLLDLQVDREAAQQLTEMSRWAKFLGLLTSIGLALIFLLMIVLWSRFAALLFPRDEVDQQSLQLGRIMLIAVILIVALVVGIMVNFLIKGANRIRQGINARDQLLFNSGLNSLKNYFAMYGVIALIGLFFELLGLVTK
jgi:hypothetical protein